MAHPSRTCHFPGWLRERRAWGVTAQFYELRSRRNWGIGDFADLAELCRTSAAAGADFVGVNPLHALFLAEPERCSPFSPSNRRFLNPLYIAVDKVEGFTPAMADADEIARMRAEPLVDYAGVASLKLGALRQVWRRRGASARAEASAFLSQGGPALRRHAVFEALSLRMRAEGFGSGWKDWPPELARADSAAVAALAEDNADEVRFHIWLQSLARRQLRGAAERARAAGMRIGLYLDLAVGETPDGSAAWSEPGLMAEGISIGAPPDFFSAGGQDWGLAAPSPERLARDGARSYRAVAEAAMQDAGALRIDHVMALRRLFWIPEGSPAAEGRFVAYPMPELVEVLAETSRRSRTLIVGEDLGHVPEGFRAAMAEAAILSYRILYFEREGPRFIAPPDWPELALACLSTHDLPTLRGWWAGSDVALRLEYGLIDAASAALQAREREEERRELVLALSACGLLPQEAEHAMERSGPPFLDALAVAAHGFVARTPSRLASIRLADAVGEEHPTNLPGTAGAYPNWRRKLSPDLEDLPELPLFRAIAAAMVRERPR